MPGLSHWLITMRLIHVCFAPQKRTSAVAATSVTSP